jgi:hypothetical protein
VNLPKSVPSETLLAVIPPKKAPTVKKKAPAAKKSRAKTAAAVATVASTTTTAATPNRLPPRNMNNWILLGKFDVEDQMHGYRSREKVSKRRTEQLKNGVKVRYRCNKWKRVIYVHKKKLAIFDRKRIFCTKNAVFLLSKAYLVHQRSNHLFKKYAKIVCFMMTKVVDWHCLITYFNKIQNKHKCLFIVGYLVHLIWWTK